MRNAADEHRQEARLNVAHGGMARRLSGQHDGAARRRRSLRAEASGYNPAVNDALSALLDPFENQLHGVARRQFVLEAFKADLDKVTRGEEFRIRNGVLWLMLSDTRNSLVVHLASWARGVYHPGGLIDRLKANHAHDLPSRRPPGPLDSDPSWRAGRDREHADALSRLFPGMSEAYPNDSQFEQLRDALIARMKPVVDDASERVHPFDRDPQAESVKALEVSALRDAIGYAERFMNDLNMVGCQTALDYREMNTPIAADVVPDMVDAILLGKPDRIERLRGELDRIAFYDELHHRNSAHPKRGSRFFNDRLFSSPSAAKIDAAGSTQAEQRYVGFFPALPLEKNIELGEWIVGSPPETTPWASRRFRDLSESLVRSFGRVGIKGGAMLWHRERGFDGSKPPDDVSRAIHAAITFAALDANDRLRLTEPDDGNKRWDMATTENADLFIQRIDEDGGIAHREGGALKSTLVGGLKIGGQPPPLADAVQSIERPLPVSNKLAAALFEAIGRDTHDGRTIATAAEWHRFAMSNPFAITPKQRIVAVKTAFEALLGTSDSRQAAHRLRVLFETATRGHHGLLPWTGLLWSPRERVEWRWEFSKKDKTRHLEGRSELERWFMALAKVRNLIIHEGELVTETYEAPPDRPLSLYAGALLYVGERVLREAIKATIGAEVLLCGALTRRAWAEKAFGDLARQLVAPAKERAAAGTNPAPTPEAHPPRPLSKILGDLKVDSAKLVVVGPLQNGGNGYTHEASAHRGQISMSITGSEFDVLSAAGAEDELPDFGDRCP
ncbi:MAG TPA: hypothetical protein VMT03_04920 [Polyangia bacterium]|nr:hypothetical protein [Polyangia bacterium]